MYVYKENGFENRKEYLLDLAAENGADPEAVFALAHMLGPDEDFDGLRVAVEDWDWGEQ